MQYVLFEVLLGVLFAYSYLKLGITISLALFLFALCVLGFIVLYDMRHTVVPKDASNLLIVICAAFSFLTSATLAVFFFHVAVAAVIGLFLFLLHYLSGGRAMGLGDTPVVFALSLLVGSAAVPGLMFSFWIGAVVGIFILSRRRPGTRMGIEVPFVPFLALGYLLAFFTTWNPLPFLL